MDYYFRPPQIGIIILMLIISCPSHAVDLINVLEQAERTDPQFREAHANALAAAAGIPQARADQKCGEHLVEC